MNVEERVKLLDKFRNDDDFRVMIAPTLAMGEGYDLEFVETAILLEREWNPAKEEQVEGRFIRATPESIEKAKRGELKATVVYPVAVDTIDEFFAELVERKRQYVKETLDGKSDYKWNESDIMLELARITVERWKER
jgi:SNF2 family DNA or RNA helicase